MFRFNDTETVKEHYSTFTDSSNNSEKAAYLKACVLKSNEDYFYELCNLMKSCPRIMENLDVILGLIHGDWAISNSPLEIERSLAIILVLLNNPHCVLKSEQRIHITRYLMLIYSKEIDVETYQKLKPRITTLLAELVLKEKEGEEVAVEGNEESLAKQDARRPNVRVLRETLLAMSAVFESRPLYTRVLCGLLHALVQMPIVGLFRVLPKCFENLKSVADHAIAVYRKKEPGPRWGEKGFDRKMEELDSGVELYWTLRDACERLLKRCFEENFTSESVKRHYDSKVCFAPEAKGLDYWSLSDFYRRCLSFFGEDLTCRLRAECSEERVRQFLDTLRSVCDVEVLDNQFVTGDKFREEQKKRSEKKDEEKPKKEKEETERKEA